MIQIKFLQTNHHIKVFFVQLDREVTTIQYVDGQEESHLNVSYMYLKTKV